MRYSMCTTFAKQRNIEEVILMASRLNLDGIEIWEGHIDGYIARNGDINKLKSLLNANGLECVTVSPYLDLITEKTVDANMAVARKCIRYARALDCPMVRVFLGDKASREVTAEEWERCFSALRELAKDAIDNGIILALEIHNGKPTDTKEAVLKVLKAVDSEALKLIFDGFNFIPDGLDMMEAYEALKDYTVHYHFKNLKWDVHICVPLDEGDADFTPLVKAVKASGYDGYISFEYFADDPSDMIRKSWDWFKQV